MSSEERGYYRDIAEEEEKEKEVEEELKTRKQFNERTEGSKIDTEKNKSRLLKLFEKMKNTKNEKQEKLKMRTIVPWIIDKDKIKTRYNFN